MDDLTHLSEGFVHIPILKDAKGVPRNGSRMKKEKRKILFD